MKCKNIPTCSNEQSEMIQKLSIMKDLLKLICFATCLGVYEYRNSLLCKYIPQIFLLMKNIKFLLFFACSFFVFSFYSNAALNDGLILHYDFETVNNNIVSDISGNNRNGTLQGNPVIQTGFKGNGVYFGNVPDYLLMPQGFINTLENYSVAVRVNIKSLNGWSRIFDFGSGTNYNMFLTPLSGANSLRFAIKNGWEEQLVDAGSPLATNEWVQITFTFSWNKQTSKGEGKLFVNGIIAATNSNITINPSMLPNTTQNYIAKSQYSDPGLNGTVDDFRIYNRTLTESEILELNGMSAALMDAYNNISISGDLKNVKSDVVLQSVAGSTNIPVVWSSSSPDIISITGKVTRPKYFDQNVILTATITSQWEGKTVVLKKEFNLTVIAASSLHWESLIVETDTFRYKPATTAPPADWYKLSFNDSGWSSGRGGFGYADNDDNTIISACNSVYIRKKINISDISQIEQLVLDIDYDDGFVMYLNGVEVARSANVNGTFPAYNAGTTSDKEALMYSGGLPNRYILKPSMLVNGENIFAVQVLNYNIGSSDLSSRVFVHAKLKADGIKYHQVPDWFIEPVDYGTSNLPLIFVDTKGQSIIQNDKIMAGMKVLNSPSGINNINDSIFEYDGFIGIEIRGFTSAGFPKKSYSVETRLDEVNNLNASLLGMPKENDWVFHGPYSDKSLMRNVLAYHLGNLTGKWSPRTRFFELYINGNYQGVYVLVEKIKIDKNRMNLATVKPEDVSGDELTGGYVLKIDRPEATDIDNVDYWISPYRAWTALQQRVFFLFQDPKGDELNSTQFNYIKNHITRFENAMYSDSYTDKVNGYFPLVDFNSFVDYYIITELSRNLDGYRISTFMHKDKDSKGGKITMGPYWDYNICFGNANFFSAGQTAGWIIDGMGDADGYAMPFWWEKFRLDPYFNDQLKRRWNLWKETYLNSNYLNSFIDSCAMEVIDAQKRNFQTWNVLSTYIWPNNYVGGSYINEINYLKTWLSSRINWMDSQIQAIEGLPDNISKETFPMDLATYPNPYVDEVNFKYYLSEAGNVSIEIFDVMGRKIYSNKENVFAGQNVHTVKMTQLNQSSGVLIYKVMVNGVVRKTGKLIKQ